MYDTTKPYTENVLDMIRQTWDTSLCSVEQSTPYSLITMRTNARQVDHTDGIGTKGHFHWLARTFAAAAQDAFAMNFNDLLLCGARPVKCQNHITIPKDDHDAVYSIISALVSLCKKTGVALTGGETSIHDNMDGMDLSVSMTGVVATKFNNKFTSGSTIIGYPSSGLHSNGFTRVRKQFYQNPGMFPFGCNFTEPTKLYHKEVWDVGHDKLNGIVHVTGGAFTKLIRFMEPGTDIDLEMPKGVHADIFKYLKDSGISCEDMYKTFNCGWGLLVATSNPNYVQSISPGTILGKVVKGGGRIKIKSAFSSEEVVY